MPRGSSKRLDRAVTRVLEADRNYGQVLSNGTDRDLHQAQMRVWEAIADLRRAVEAEADE